jgi:glutamate-ammonia-ligase adenylyltransferase
MGPPSAFAALNFREPARAAANLALLEERLPAPLRALLPTLLAQVPDPGGALNRLERFTRELPPRVTDAVVRQPALLHYLLALFAHSSFLSETLIQQPELVLWLGRERNLERLKSREELLEEYARFEATAHETEPGLALARFKRRQYLRITLRDILGLATLVETTLELSVLADVLLEKALTRAQTELRARYGSPQTLDARGRLVPARFAVLSLGKLGGEELNYSSDVDLLFLFDGDGETSAREAENRLANSEYFIRLAQRLLQIIAGVTRLGPVFRVDLRLRPGGGEGDVALSLAAAVGYYRQRAREWELQMLLKARHSAGDEALVREFLAAVEPFLYRGAMHFAAVEAVLKTREELDHRLDAAGAGRTNVKLAPGGLRDVEFLVQCLQRVHGQQDPWVRAAGTLVGLQKLFDKGYLSARDHFRLAEAYQFLRRIEHRLQLEQGEQTHTLPAEAVALDLLARRCGFGGAHGRVEFLAAVNQHTDNVQVIYDRVLPRGREGEVAEGFALRPPELVPLPGDAPLEEILRRLHAVNSPLAAALPSTALAGVAARSTQQFLSAALSSSPTYEAVCRAAAALPHALEILRLSEPLAALLERRPERLATLAGLEECATAEARQLSIALPESSGAGLPADLERLVRQPATLPEQMAGLRRWFTESVFLWGAREVCHPGNWEQALAEYTRLAEAVLRAGWAITGKSQTEVRDGIAVLALGRLGTEEMDLGSDADLVFVARAEELQRGRERAEKLIHLVSAYTREGTLFPADLRLRPRGGEGELVQSTDYLFSYFASTAEVWEAVTYLKARPVAGDILFGEEVCQRVREILAERFHDSETVRSALAAMRRRLEAEAASAFEERDNFKTGPGGVYDLDFLLSAAALRAGGLSQAGRPLAAQVDLFAAEAGLRPEDGNALRQTAFWLRVADHAVRLATGRGTARLPRGPRAEAVAELTSRWAGETLSVNALSARLAEVRRKLREQFLRTFA